MSKGMSRGIAFVVGAVLSAAAVTSASAADENVAAFYKGKTITVIVGSSPGGGYDLYGRMVSRWLGQHVPGQPTVVPSNMPGAGSHTAAAYIYNSAPKDGTVIGALQSVVAFEPFLAGRNFNYDPTKFVYLGSANDDVYTCIARTDAKVQKFEDLFSTELLLGGVQSSSPADNPIFINNVLNTKFKIITGYPGTREIGLAIDRNEVHGACGVAWPSISVTNPGWFNGGQPGRMRVIVQTHATGSPDLNQQGVPKIADFAKTDEQRVMLNLYFSQTAFGRPYLVSPDVPKERIAALRAAFEATIKDPKLQEDAKKIGIEANHVPGEKLQDMVQKLYATPPDLTAKMKAATVPKT
jgi:tripartite-type tricarboxylate transporter receptor subunit TctC